MSNYEFGAGLWMFQQFIDRYATDAYGPPVSTLQAIERAAAVGEIKVLDINYPFAGEGVTVAQVQETLQRTGLRAQAITPHLYMREFQMGSFTHPDPAVRRKAVDLGKQAVEVAHQLDARYVKFWPGQDGFDYPFQVDYGRLWEYSVEGVRAVAQADPGMQFAIEYKAKEPRTHMFFSSAGPLGHGLPVAVGAAIAAKLQDSSWRVFALTGDGELQEGSNWEAAMSAAHYKLDNLTAIVDRNRLQQGDWTEQTMHLEPLADKWRAFGWSVREVDGHNIAELLETFSHVPFEPGKPNCIIAHTHKGQGVSFMRDKAAWHHRVPNVEELAAALKELEEVTP